MKQKKKTEQNNFETGKYSPPTWFEAVMNVRCDLHAELGLPPIEHWQKTRETPQWSKNIYRKLRSTILKSLWKLKPNGVINWRNYGRSIGIMERYKTFLLNEASQLLVDAGIDEITEEKWERIQPMIGEEQARQYWLKVLKLPADDKTPLLELADIVTELQLANLEKMKAIAFGHIAEQSAKTKAVFLKGMSEGFTMFLNEDGEFTGDDRRADIHMELLAWQHDIEKMRRSILPKTNSHLIGELKRLPEFKNKTNDAFKDIFRSIKLSIGRRGRPSGYSQA